MKINFKLTLLFFLIIAFFKTGAASNKKTECIGIVKKVEGKLITIAPSTDSSLPLLDTKVMLMFNSLKSLPNMPSHTLGVGLVKELAPGKIVVEITTAYVEMFKDGKVLPAIFENSNVTLYWEKE